MKRVLNPLLPQINITEQCESLCIRQIIFENPPEQTLGFDSGTKRYMLINQSRAVVASLAYYSYSKLVRLEGFKSVKNDFLNGDVTPRIL